MAPDSQVNLVVAEGAAISAVSDLLMLMSLLIQVNTY